MPSIADSLKGAGYMGDVGDAFKKILFKSKQNSEQEQFNQTLGDAFKQMQDTIRPTGEDVNSIQSGPGSTRLTEFQPKGMAAGAGAPQETNDPMNPQAPKSLNDIANLRTSASVKAYGEMSPAEQQKYHMGILADTMMKSEQFKNLDPAMKERMLKSLQMKAESIEPNVPSSQLKAFKTDEDLYNITKDKTGATTYKKVKSGQQKPKYSAASTIKADEDDPQGRYKKGDDIIVKLDENDPDNKVYVGRADTTTKDVQKENAETRKEQLKVSQAELGLKIKTFNENMKQKDPKVILQSGKETLDAINEQLKQTNEFTDEGPFKELIAQKIKTTAAIKKAAAQLQQNPAGSTPGSGKPKFNYGGQ